jgi:seryl-tRNA synthetase
MRGKLLLAGLIALGLSSVLSVEAQDRTSGPSNGRGACRALIKYRIGALDPRFGITREAFQHDVEQARQVWEAAAGRTLFQDDSRGPLEIDLVYDSRQETTQHFIAARSSIAAKLKQADAIEEKLDPLRNKFAALDKAYSEQLSAYNRHQDDYNKRVAQWNTQGGAPEGAYQDLQSERLGLRKQAAALSAGKEDLNRLVDEINALVRDHNGLVQRANAEAETMNRSSSGIEFEEGRYLRRGGDERIEVFQYEGETALQIILAHELGHALGMQHNANPASIMSPLIHTDRLVLTAEDRNGLGMACSLH